WSVVDVSINKKSAVGGQPWLATDRGPGTTVLPGEVGEGLVRIGHLDGVLALGHRLAFTAVSSHELIGQADEHRPALLAPRRLDDPANRQALLADPIHLHRHLVSSAADALGTHLHGRLDVLDRLNEDVDWLGVGHAFLDLVHGAIKDALGGRLL